MALQFFYPEDVKRIAEALVNSNPDPAFRYGVALLAHALGADLRQEPIHCATVPAQKTIELLERRRP